MVPCMLIASLVHICSLRPQVHQSQISTRQSEMPHPPAGAAARSSRTVTTCNRRNVFESPRGRPESFCFQRDLQPLRCAGLQEPEHQLLQLGGSNHLRQEALAEGVLSQNYAQHTETLERAASDGTMQRRCSDRLDRSGIPVRPVVAGQTGDEAYER